MYGAVTPLKQSRDAIHVVAETIKKTYVITLNTPQLVVGKWQVPANNVATIAHGSLEIKVKNNLNHLTVTSYTTLTHHR